MMDEIDGPNPDYTECIYGVKPGFQEVRSGVDWTRCLIEVDSGLDESDVEQLKFLLRGCISDARLKKLSCGTEIFQELHNSGYIDIDNGSLDILEECLYRIHRKDLIRKLGGRDHLQIRNRLERYKEEIKRKMDPKEDPKSLLPFRVMLFEIGEDIDESEFKSAIFALGSVVPKGQLQKMDSVLDLFIYLEKKDELSHENVEILPKVLHAIDRGDLLEKVRQYKNNYKRQLSINVFLHLAPILAKKPNWEQILIDLGLTKTDLDSIRRKSPPEVFKIVNEALLYWKDKVMKNSEECSKRLIDVLQRSGIQASLTGTGLNLAPTSGPGTAKNDERTPVRPFVPVTENLSSRTQPPPTPPNMDTDRRVTEMETQTSMLFPEQGRQTSVIRDDNLPNRAVTHDLQTEALAEQLRAAAGINDDEMDMPSYKMDTKPRGIAVIINNEKFFKVPSDRMSKEMPPRVGTEKDADNLVYIFRKLDFIVERYNDLQDFEIVRKLVEIAYNRDHTNYDCLVVCILSHGVLGHVYGTNGRLVNIKDCTGCFRAQVCPSLAGKPKLFFIQACQGREKQGGTEIEKDSDLESDNAPKEMIPDEADFVLGYATVPGYVSYRSRSQGSWYVNKLVQMLEKYSARYDLLSILIKVNEEVGRANAHLDGGHYKQIPAPLVTLRKRLYFR
ncbi:hypothetical protein FSP39_024443 [Pinctada imbricata]|uniref:Caspase-8 n=1 Tax=Pinctada imbricata TaxID=66713 RepID=A0AA88XE42_PINIB|nr:hypothetical protein FSP39_024443 [Pinctada imbricata]